ncbi:MAG: undecaprenyl-diphosphatase UppP [Anaeromyxobacteraceae bacterium]
MGPLAAVLLGIVQAVTEFLPVSSTAHLLLVGEFLGESLGDPRFRAFVTIIQSGTAVAVVVYFRADLWRLASAWLSAIRAGRPLGTADARLAWYIALGTLPAAILGKLLERRIEALGNGVIAFSLVFWGLAMAAAERWASHRRTIADLTARSALAIGVGQALALVPGTSRSGSTITTGMMLGFSREAAARFSFLLSVPIILGAGAYKLAKALPVLRGEPSWRTATVLGTLVSAVVGYLVIGWLLRYLRTRTTYLFVAWRIALGVLVAVLLWQGVLPADDDAPAPPPAVRAR